MFEGTVTAICGIFGMLSKSGLDETNLENFNKFFEIQNHRGPDGYGEHISKNFSFGMVRLSIIDIEKGSQPFWNGAKTIGVIANGEVYNYQELRMQLIATGHEFNTDCDIEVILHLYEDLGPDFIGKLRGMFAIAIIDLNINTLILGRDRLGEKPLYVYQEKDKVVFSSELRSLIQCAEVPLEFDSRHIQSYLKYGLIPEPYTLIKNVRKVKSATIEFFSLSDSTHASKTYWDFESDQQLGSNVPHVELRKLLEDVIELETNADVPIGIALSGGMDSSLIASLMTNSTPLVHAFCVGYSGKHATDESSLASQFAEDINVKLSLIKLESTDVAKQFSELCLLRDEPIADIAGAGYLAVAKLMRSNGVKVLLNGQGADELFWGYEWAIECTRIGNRRARLLNGGRNYLEYFRIKPLPSTRGAKFEWLMTGFGLNQNLKHLIEDIHARKKGDYSVLVYERRPRQKRINRIRKSLVNAPMHKDPFTLVSLSGELDVSRYVFETIVQVYLKSNGLTQLDRLSMATSVEARTPFVDHKVVELAYRELVNANKFNTTPKAILKASCDNLLPASLLDRKKLGFTPPVREWYKKIYSEYEEDFRNPRIVDLGLVNINAIKILKRPTDNLGRPSILWLELAVLEMWVRGLESMSGKANKID